MGVVDSSVFSVMITKDDNSEIIFGGYDLEKYGLQDRNILWTKLSNTLYWTLPLNLVKANDFELSLISINLIVDTGTSLLYMPKYEYKQLTNYIGKGKTCYEQSSTFYCDCFSLEDYPTLEFKIGYHYFKLYPETYINIYSAGFSNYCVM